MVATVRIITSFDKDPIRCPKVVIKAIKGASKKLQRGIDEAAVLMIQDMRSIIAKWETFSVWTSVNNDNTSVYNAWRSSITKHTTYTHTRTVVNISPHILALEGGVRPHIVPLGIPGIRKWVHAVLPANLAERAEVLGYIAVGGKNSRIKQGSSQRKFLRQGLDKFKRRKYRKKMSDDLKKFFDSLIK